jgi:hypothetical protein
MSKMNPKKIYHVIPLAFLVIFQIITTTPVYAAGTVGIGTPESCDEATFDTVLMNGGTVTFDCGPSPVTITLTSTKVIAQDTQINGGGLITLNAENASRHFLVNTGIQLEITGLTLSNGNLPAGTGGGAIFTFSGSTLKITDSTFSNNSSGSATAGGGAIYNQGTLIISGSTFNQNTAAAAETDGGAILSTGSDSSVDISNSTFYGNSAGTGPTYTNSTGGAVNIRDSDGTNTITQVTFANNTNDNLYGVLDIINSSATVSNTILANSVTGVDCSKRGTGTITSTNNLIEVDFACGAAVTSDPRLGSLQNNGGLTQTMAISPTSPAYNYTLTCPVGKDQRGIDRPQPVGGKCDLGALEIDNPPPFVSNVTSLLINKAYGIGSLITINVTFSNSVVVTGTPLLTLETGATDRTAVYFSGSGSNMLNFIYTVQPGDTSSDLDYVSINSLALNGGTIKKMAGNDADLYLPGPGASGSLAFNKDIVIDTTSPSLTSFMLQNPATSPTNANSLVFRAIFSEAVTNVDTDDFAVDGTTTAPVTNVATVNPSTYDITVSNGNLAGFNGVVGINLKVGQDIVNLLGNPLPTTEPAIDQTYTLDNIQPSGDTILRASPNPTGASSVNFAVTFTKSVNNVDGDDFVLTTSGGITGASITGSSGTGSTYTVTVNTGSGNGTIRLDLRVNGTIQDAAGNGLDGAQIGDEFYTIDKTLPSVSSITRVNESPINAPSVDFTVIFNKTVNGVDKDDFVLTTSGAISGATVTTVNGTGANRTVTVDTGTGDGTIRLDVKDNNTIVDTAGNPLGGDGPDNGDFTAGETYSIMKSKNVYVKIGNNLEYTYNIPSKTATSNLYNGVVDGPVRVKSLNGTPVFTSQRAIYGNSFNELTGFPADQLTTDYWFTYYDDVNMSTWLMIGNADPALTAHVEVYLGNDSTPIKTYDLAHGESVLPRLGVVGGPLRVISTNGVKIFTSQRAAYLGSFNELMGFPADQLTTDYWFTYYDDVNMATWLMIGNADPIQSAHVEVYLGNGSTPIRTFDLDHGESVLPKLGVVGGPLRVVSTNGVKIFTSQRAAYGNSFNELMGFPADQLTTDYWFTYYDDVNMSTWLMIGNADPVQTAHVEVYLGNDSTPIKTYDLDHGQSVLPKLDVAGGPLRVVSTNGVEIFTSERVAYGSSFNELMGFPADQLTTDYWFTYYDDVNMSTWLMIGKP